VGLSVSFVALVALSRWREECADKLAITVCSDAARKSAPEFYATLKEVQAESRDDEKDSYFLKMYKKILITENGENRFDILHPSLSTRIGYLSSRNR
jgi:Zn-dependent protease with chaperone function